MSVQSVDLRQAAENLGDPDHGEILRINDGVTPGSAHALSARAEELKGWLCRDGRPPLPPLTRVQGPSKTNLLRPSHRRALELFYELRPIHRPRSFGR